jgi:hypothetical protein
MQVEMKHGLPRAESIVDDGPVAIREFALPGNLRGDELHSPKDNGILHGSIGE